MDTILPLILHPGMVLLRCRDDVVASWQRGVYERSPLMYLEALMSYLRMWEPDLALKIGLESDLRVPEPDLGMPEPNLALKALDLVPSSQEYLLLLLAVLGPFQDHATLCLGSSVEVELMPILE